MPLSYSDKKQMLLDNRIGLWDVAHSAQRNGSLDTAIKEEEPNDVEGFIEKHKHLRIIAFNGAKSEKLYDTYFRRKSGIKYLSLPSSSPANKKLKKQLKNIYKMNNFWLMGNVGISNNERET